MRAGDAAVARLLMSVLMLFIEARAVAVEATGSQRVLHVYGGNAVRVE